MVIRMSDKPYKKQYRVNNSVDSINQDVGIAFPPMRWSLAYWPFSNSKPVMMYPVPMITRKKTGTTVRWVGFIV